VTKSLQQETLRRHLLEASTEDEIDDVFEELFDFLDDARQRGDAEGLAQLLVWAAQPEVLTIMNYETPLTILRLSFSACEHVEESWKTLRNNVTAELMARNLNAEQLLWGLKD